MGKTVAIYQANCLPWKGCFDPIARRYEAVEQDCPALRPADLFHEIDYFAEFPHQVVLAAPVREDFTTRFPGVETHA